MSSGVLVTMHASTASNGVGSGMYMNLIDLSTLSSLSDAPASY